MIQIIKNDLIYLFLENKKYVLTYFAIILLVVGFQNFIDDVEKMTYYILDGMIFVGVNEMLFFFYNLFFLISLIMKLFIKDIQDGKENIFLRINLKNWLVIKFISIFICTLIFRIIYMLFLSLLLKHNLSINDFACEAIYVLFVLAFTISSIVLRYKFKFIWIVIPTILFLLLLKYGITYLSIIENWYKFIGVSFITIFLNYIFTSLIGIKIFEVN